MDHNLTTLLRYPKNVLYNLFTILIFQIHVIYISYRWILILQKYLSLPNEFKQIQAIHSNTAACNSPFYLSYVCWKQWHLKKGH